MATMVGLIRICWLFGVAAVVDLMGCDSAATSTLKKVYIVHMNQHLKPTEYSSHADWYAAHLQSTLSSDNGDETVSESDGTTSGSEHSLLYAYDTVYNGFAASLNAEQAESLRQSEAVLGVYEDPVYSLHTTRTPEFLGLDKELLWWHGHTNEELNLAAADVIIGVLDTGVWPESPCFSDALLRDKIPERWRGECQAAADFHPSPCNRKLIGARSFSKGFSASSGTEVTASPRDVDGHGTHTASTAAGSPVSNASLLGYAPGLARGMAPRARLAAYKVCWESGCFGSDILAAMQRAVEDGVDVLSLSLGGTVAAYDYDPIAIGAFTAMERGVFVSCSAGNSGPKSGTLANVAPWIMTVGAGTLDRDFPAFVDLGDRKRFTGVSLYSGEGMGTRPVGLVYANGGGNKVNNSNLCLPGTVEPAAVKGKVVFCDRGVNSRVDKGRVAKEAGALGMILANAPENGEELVADAHLLPAVAVGLREGNSIKEYARTHGATAVLSFGGTVVRVKPTPVVAAFSSRGPNVVTPQILKPDVIGPGVNILAGWSQAVAPTGLHSDNRRTLFNIISGTSMSCPHIAGLAALLKAAHPEWSPSAIKSALMTTAYNRDNTRSPLRDAAFSGIATPWAEGAGHVNLQRALAPGLVYDISPADYISFLCSLDYGVDRVRAVSKHPNATCSSANKLSDPGELNYPSFSVLFSTAAPPPAVGKRRKKLVVRYTRQLKSVEDERRIYRVSSTAPPGVVIKVRPTTLVFRRLGDVKSYTVTFVANRSSGSNLRNGFGSIVWASGMLQVRSPLSVSWT